MQSVTFGNMLALKTILMFQLKPQLAACQLNLE